MENFQVKVRRILTFDATIAELAKFISKIMRQMTIPQDEFKIKKLNLMSNKEGRKFILNI